MPHGPCPSPRTEASTLDRDNLNRVIGGNVGDDSPGTKITKATNGTQSEPGIGDPPNAQLSPVAVRPSATRRTIQVAVSLAIVIAAAIAAYELGRRQTRPRFADSMLVEFHTMAFSMEPTIQPGAALEVNESAYLSATPAIGDIIVFTAPHSALAGCLTTATDLVSRIVAVSGDTISSAGNSIYVNGTPLSQGWGHYPSLIIAIHAQTIPPDSYFVLGDNRPQSCDSRIWGTVSRADIVGKVVAIH